MHHPGKPRMGRVRRTPRTHPGRFDDNRVYVRSRRPLNSSEFVERQ
ncbi:hypothetical protein BN903_38 [Halorubrum sp. AJ67]|nr:hypothetical protein BN903_38 [Halorubrum sp. AJ67]